MIHYHGTPITPNAQLNGMAGRNFCVSFARPDQLKTCLSIGQSVMLDNGAFSAYTKGIVFDHKKYYEWLEPILMPPHWAVMPDSIGGSVEDQYKLLSTWPRETLGYSCAAPVFHLHLPLSYLWELMNGYDKVCLGSSGEFWNVGSPNWCRKMDEIFNHIEKWNIQRREKKWIHGMRMLGQLDGGWPLASADSTNVAQNHKSHGCANCMAEKIDSQNFTRKWSGRELQQSLFISK